MSKQIEIYIDGALVAATKGLQLIQGTGITITDNNGEITINSAGGSDPTKLAILNNLSDLDDVPTALANLGLDNVDNTTDLNKPISTATQTALNAKYNNPTGTPDGTKYLRDDNSWQPVTGGSGLSQQQVMAIASLKI